MNNIITSTDSYKASHFLQYPPGTEKVNSYIEARGTVYPDVDKTVFFGLQAYIKEYLANPITQDNIDEADDIFKLHGVPFNRKGWEYILNKYNGYLPVYIEAIPEGTPVELHNALVQIRNTDPNVPWLTSYLETSMLRAVWYPTSVATYSYYIKEDMMEYAEKCGTGFDDVLFKLHDFGARGVSSKESAMIGGLAHLVNFRGTDTVEALIAGRKWYDENIAGFSIPACYDDKTEILTDSGWKLFANLNDADLVAQYNKDGTVEFVNFTNYVNEQYSGDMYHFTSRGKVAKYDLMVTPNHRMVRRSKTTGKLEIFEAKDFTSSHRNVLPQSGYKKDGNVEFSDIDRLKIAFQADGSFFVDDEKRNGKKTNTKGIRFSLKKERKKKRLEYLFDTLEIEYTARECSNEKHGCVEYYVKVPIEYNISKTFDWVDVGGVNSEYAQQFINELQFWDGTKKQDSIVYSSVIKLNVDVVSALSSIGGYRCNITEYFDKRENRQPIYIACISKHQYRQGNNIDKNIVQYNGRIYCVTVPSGMIMVRRNGVVSISGNSEHSTITVWGKENEVDAYRNMLKQFAKPGSLVACVSDSYDIYNAVERIWGETLKDDICNSGATVIVRPDSGDPVQVPIDVIEILMNKFGFVVNEKGYRVLPNCIRVIQGDGINRDSIKQILTKLDEKKIALDNIAFGMGGALLQQTNRDTFKFAMKASWAEVNGVGRDVYKQPITDSGKSSKKGLLAVGKNSAGKHYTVNKWELVGDNQLVPVFIDGKLYNEQTFEDVRKRAIT